ncbi:unnamed protein product, partial [Adineta ricciae]
MDIECGTIPIGMPFPGMQAHILDQYYQPVFVGQVGELFLDGVQHFEGYYNQDYLTEQTRYGSLYRTGDLVRQDSMSGKLYYEGRRDFQIKLRGQRVELGEIERCLLECVPTCAVIKCDEQLVAYVQGKDIHPEHLRSHCKSRLPLFMIPSNFIVMDHFPLNTNGKLDRRALSKLVKLPLAADVVHMAPNNELELIVHRLWCQVLNCDGPISTKANFFSLGGHSMLLMQLYHRYQTSFEFDSKTTPIVSFFRQSSIAEHATILEKAIHITNKNDLTSWKSLHLTQGLASFAQERIHLDQQMRFLDIKHDQNSVAPYNELTVLKLTTGTVSLLRLQRAVRCVMAKHQILRTSLDFAPDGDMLVQRVTKRHQTFDFAPQQTFEDNKHLKVLLSQIIRNVNLFNLSNGLVFHCQPLRHCLSENNSNSDLLLQNDIILIAIHHIAIDRTSLQIFLKDLSDAYNRDTPLTIDADALQYIDYAAHERQLDMSTSGDFWRAQLDGYDLERGLVLPVDRHRLSNNERSGRAWVGQFSFDDDLSRSFLSFASSHNVTLFQLGLATFYAYLFKLTGGQQDLCVGSINANRYRVELRDLIGMFVATLPYRVQLDPNGSFEQLVEQVRDRCLSILEHSHYPLQHIIGSHHAPAFLETMFDFITIESNDEQMSLDGAVLESVPLEQSDSIAKFDMMVTLVHSQSTGISCSIVCSQDLFDDTTVQLMTERFSCLLHHLFNSALFTTEKQPLHQLSLILPHEQLLIDAMKNNDNHRPSSTDQTISQLFCEKVSSYSQKVAVDLDEQSLTYSELLVYAQHLAVVLIDTHGVKEGDIVCQCVERSLSM